LSEWLKRQCGERGHEWRELVPGRRDMCVRCGHVKEWEEGGEE
jgi:hypothetical protein